MKNILMVLILIVIAGCASPAKLNDAAFDREMSEYGKSVPTDAAGKVLLENELYFNNLLSIAIKYDKSQFADLFRMMSTEAYMKRKGQPNIYDSLEKRWDAADPKLFVEAEKYKWNALAVGKCSSFGYASGSGDFNKCVYEIKLQMLKMQIQQEQFLMQLTKPAPIYIPERPKTTTCQTTYDSFSGQQTTCQQR